MAKLTPEQRQIKAAEKLAAKQVREAKKLAEKKAKAAAREAERAAKRAAKEAAKYSIMGKNFQKNRESKQMKSFCKEISYYRKEFDAGKALYCCPGAERIVEWTEKKCCSKCGQEKVLAVFAKNDTGEGNIIRSDRRRNRRPDCKVCQSTVNDGMDKAKACAKRLGISYKAPEGTVCRICGKLPNKGKSLVFDHHHELDVFRGYCCNRCNIGMGILGDTVTSLAGVVKYMNESEGLSKEQIMAIIFN